MTALRFVAGRCHPLFITSAHTISVNERRMEESSREWTSRSGRVAVGGRKRRRNLSRSEDPPLTQSRSSLDWSCPGSPRTTQFMGFGEPQFQERLPPSRPTVPSYSSSGRAQRARPLLDHESLVAVVPHLPACLKTPRPGICPVPRNRAVTAFSECASTAARDRQSGRQSLLWNEQEVGLGLDEEILPVTSSFRAREQKYPRQPVHCAALPKGEAYHTGTAFAPLSAGDPKTARTHPKPNINLCLMRWRIRPDN
nr:hypothetical protein CFP56_03698 [Quercus suber]